MDINDIKRLSGEKKAPLGIIEKDYALSLMLSLLANSSISDHLVFKGETAVKKMYFPNARFSVDLDFDFVDITIDNIKKEVAESIKPNNFDTVKFMKIKGEFESENEEVYRCMIEYTGPIKHNLNQSVRLDFSGRKTPYNVQEKQIIDDYGSETAHVMVRTMDLAEMFAEKCRALITRKEQKSKDLFDIYFLINKDVVVDRRLINIKFTGYNESFNENYFDRAVRDTASVWKRDLQDLIPRGNVPDIDNVISLVRRKLF